MKRTDNSQEISVTAKRA